MSGISVIKIGGSTLEDIDALAPLWACIAARAAAGERLVLVHGGGKAVDALLARLGMPTTRIEGLRVTPPDQMEIIAGVLAGSVNKRLVGAINAQGGRAVGLCLGDGAMLRCDAMTRTPSGTSADLGRVGIVRGGDAAIIRTLVADGFTPVVSSIGLDARGGLLNINADDGASALAASLGADRLVLLTDVPGVRDGAGRTCPSLTPRAIQGMIERGEISGGMIPKVRAALDAAGQSGRPVLITSTTAFAGGSEERGTVILPKD
ncbi:MAG: acetylglutamate kinase [Leptolyngbya sp. PLA1]|nr:acetylglutamate kinase [Leptolyngbya sp. PLA1]